MVVGIGSGATPAGAAGWKPLTQAHIDWSPKDTGREPGRSFGSHALEAATTVARVVIMAARQSPKPEQNQKGTQSWRKRSQQNNRSAFTPALAHWLSAFLMEPPSTSAQCQAIQSDSLEMNGTSGWRWNVLVTGVQCIRLEAPDKAFKGVTGQVLAQQLPSVFGLLWWLAWTRWLTAGNFKSS